jgi:N-acetylmuramoyl-L-alanine amidase
MEGEEMKDERLVLILNPGHGGVAAGHYFTPGKRSPEVPPGFFEGEMTRQICQEIQDTFIWRWESIADKVAIVNTNPGPINLSEGKTLIPFINRLCRAEKHCLLLSIHTNASRGNGWHNATGYTTFISKNASRNSTLFADLLDKSIKENGYPLGSRGIKKNGLWINAKTKCPAALLECGFHNNKDDVAVINSYSPELVEGICDAVCKYAQKVLGLENA